MFYLLKHQTFFTLTCIFICKTTKETYHEQQDEQQQDCRKWNILYENRCQVCMIKVEDDGVGVNKDGKGVYVGETSRSMYERTKEHQRDKELRSEVGYDL